MFFEINDKQEDKVQKNARRLQELIERAEDLQTKEKEFLEEMEVSPKQLTQLISDKDTFCKAYNEESWELLRAEKEKLDRKLVTDIENIRNPQKTKSAFESLNVPRHGFFVR